MNKQEYLDKVKALFNDYFQDEIMCTREEIGGLPRGIAKPLFNERALVFAKEVKNLGLSFSNCYHEYGIGNNNEYKIFLKSMDEDGFEIEKNVCVYRYVYSLYCGLVKATLYDTDRRLLSSAGRI